MAATKEEHLEKVAENLAFLASIHENTRGAFCWSITVLFYTALHYIEAYFASHDKGFTNHASRGIEIRRDPRIKSIYRTYRKLEDLSREARYDASAMKQEDVERAKTRFEHVRRVIEAIL